MCRIRVAALGFIALFAQAASAADWPCFRGPNHDNVSTETGWQTDWKAHPPKLLWQAATGNKWGCPVVAGGRVFVHGDDYLGGRAGKETLFALDAAAGKELWKDESSVFAYNNQPITYSPTADGDRVYFYTSSGTLKCLDAATGNPVWVEDLSKSLRAYREVNYGYRCSPVIWQDCVIVTTRGGAPKDAPQEPGPSLVAFDRMTGNLLWTNVQPSIDLKN